MNPPGESRDKTGRPDPFGRAGRTWYRGGARWPWPEADQQSHAFGRHGSSPPRGSVWNAVAVIELLLAAAAVIRDLFVPTFILLALAALSLVLRRQGLSSLGFRRSHRPWTMAAQVLGLTAAWTLLQLALFMPVLNHVIGDHQDLSDFKGLEGNAGQLALLLALSWTLAAFGEEIAYRGFIPTRITDLLGTRSLGLIIAVIVSSALFAVAHTEQGVIGVTVTFFDGLFFSVLRLRYGTLLAPVLAHGFNNTIGLFAFFLIGPVYGLW